MLDEEFDIMNHVGPMTEEADVVHNEKYRAQMEDFREAMNRIAAATQDDHGHFKAFRAVMLRMGFMAAGRVQAAMGSLKSITAYNCFVMGTVHDSFTDGPSEQEIKSYTLSNVYTHHPTSIMKTATEAAQTMRQGGGVGYDISTLRPAGDLIRGVQSTTDGPLAFAPIWDAVCKATSSAGNRRGAQMLVMRVDHPDIERFIRAKHVNDDRIPYDMRPLRGFNMSVAITDEFMVAVENDTMFALRFNGIEYRQVKARALWDMIMRSTYDWAEPGVLFIDTINRMNNLWYCEIIAATNPCGEQPLPPYGACLLGSINMVKYLIKTPDGSWEINYNQLAIDLPVIVRGMDNVIDRTQYPLPQQELEAKSKRRMGIGVTSLANAVEAMGYPYGSEGFLAQEEAILKFITNTLYRASAMLAAEKGPFPLFDMERYLEGQFIQTLEPETIALIKKHGIRNSHLTSIAPTGTISFCADNVSSGIEPVFSYETQRRVIMKSGPEIVNLTDYGLRFLGVKGKLSQDVTPDEHVKVLCMAQKYMDSAVSKTCNVPSDISYDDFKDIYMKVYKNGGKGCTTYRPNGKYDEVLKVAPEKKAEELDVAEGEACGFDSLTGARTGNCAD